MAEQQELFDWKHARLWRFAYMADFFASLVIVITILLALGVIYQYSQMAHTQYQTDVIGMLSQKPIYFIDISLQAARILLQGTVFYLVLKGVAMGLNMIVETDINYREKAAEDASE